jgi:hypothetical protein
MSTALAIAGVTAVLRDLLNNGLIDHNISGAVGSNVTVTAIPPDTIRIDGAQAQTQLNLFLHQVTPNPGWRNVGLPSRDGRGARLSNPPLALDLHYLLSAYGSAELHAEILLGYAMQLLHEHPVLDRDSIRTALAGGTVPGSILPPAFQALAATDLADQLEEIKITPVTLGTEEMSRLWAAIQAHYRPTAAYQVSVVLIESRQATRAALPVLTRGPRDPVHGRERGVVAQPDLTPPFPLLTAVEPPNRQIAARLGENLVLHGFNLDGSNLKLRFEHPRRDTPLDLTVGPNDNGARVTVSLPDSPQSRLEWPAGAWSVSVRLQRPGESEVRSTNSMPLLLAPRLDIPASAAVRNGDAVTITLALSPAVWDGQDAWLNAGGREVPASAFGGPAPSLDFAFPELGGGEHWLRLRVDGVDSLLVDRSVTPPRFDPTQRITVPP